MSDRNNFAGQYLSHLFLVTSYLKILSESGAFSGRPWHLGMALLVRLRTEPGQQRKNIS